MIDKESIIKVVAPLRDMDDGTLVYKLKIVN